MATKAFETQTVPSKQSLVDDKLKPIAELHILVGGPYKFNGEEHRYGHTALRLLGPREDVTYDFGRYGATRGIFEETGDGVLRVWTEFAAYIKSENALGRVTTGFVYPVFEHQFQAVKSHYGGLIAAGKPMPSKDRAGMKVYRLATDYHVLAPNCTTLSLEGARQAIANIDAGSDKYNKPEEVLTLKERLALASTGGAPRLFLPANLERFLTSGSPGKAIRVDRYGG